MSVMDWFLLLVSPRTQNDQALQNAFIQLCSLLNIMRTLYLSAENRSDPYIFQLGFLGVGNPTFVDLQSFSSLLVNLR